MGEPNSEVAVTEESVVITDDMLDAAAAEVEEAEEEEEASEEETKEETEEAEEEEEVEEETEEQEPEEPVDNADRSKMGRKLAAAHRRLDEERERISRIESALEKILELQTRTQEEDELYDDDAPITKKQAEKILDEREKRRAKEIEDYQADYIDTIATIGIEYSEEEHGEIVEEMMANFNQRHSDDPKADAEKNYSRAVRAVYKKKSAQPIEKKNPLKGTKPKAKLGVAQTQKVEKSEPALPELEDEAKEFLADIRKREGDETADSLHKSLNKPAKSYHRVA